MNEGQYHLRTITLPSEEEVRAERERLQYRKRRRKTMRTAVCTLAVAAVVAALLASLFLPVLRVSGSSMEPTLEEGDIILLIAADSFQTGDLIGFYHQNKLLVKRIIGEPGDVIDIDDEGNVSVNGEWLDEPYVADKALGETDLTYPYQVPEGQYFVMGDNRMTSVDSRSGAIACIEAEQIVGKVVLRIWPPGGISLFN